MKKNIVRLTESQLHRVIKESVNKILNGSTSKSMLDEGLWGDIKDLFKSDEELEQERNESSARARAEGTEKEIIKYARLALSRSDPKYYYEFINATNRAIQYGILPRYYVDELVRKYYIEPKKRFKDNLQFCK